MLPKIFFFITSIVCLSIPTQASLLSDLQRLQKSYPDEIQAVSKQYITWKDGTKMPVSADNPHRTETEKIDSSTLADQIWNVHYPVGIQNTPPKNDPGRIRYIPFFMKIYGETPEKVKNHLVTIYWLSGLYGKQYPLQVTILHHVDQKLLAISRELEKLPPSTQKYLINPAGTFQWRLIADTNRLSMHSFGMTIDINTQYSNYWQWDLKKAGQPVNEKTPLSYENHIPWEIVTIFEKYGFIWGGKWYHYDTMHFEYRPELLP